MMTDTYIALILGDAEGQGSLVGFRPWGYKDLDTT